jgi:hypothetical protein
MTKPETLFETASYDLNKFRERRMAERRASLRDTPDRRVSASGMPPAQDNRSPNAEEPGKQPD